MHRQQQQQQQCVWPADKQVAEADNGEEGEEEEAGEGSLAVNLSRAAGHRPSARAKQLTAGSRRRLGGGRWAVPAGGERGVPIGGALCVRVCLCPSAHINLNVRNRNAGESR